MTSAQLQLLHNESRDSNRYYEEASHWYQQAHPNYPEALMQQALEQARKAQALNPTHLPTLNLLARIEQRRHHYTEAKLWLEQGLQLKPQSASLLYSAGQLALVQNNLAEAEQYFTQSVQVSRVATRALNSLAHVKYLQGDYVEAFRHYRELAKTQADNLELRSQLFATCAKLSADYYSEELEQDLLRYLDFTDVDHSQLHSLTASLLMKKFKLSEIGSPLSLEQLAQDCLLLKCLEKFYFTDPIFERLFITLRQSILFSSSSQLAINKELLPLASALAQQTWLNESVWYITDQEDRLVAQLETLTQKLLLLDEVNPTDIAPALLLVLMYKPLAQCSFAKQISSLSGWPDFILAGLKKQKIEMDALRTLIGSTPSLGESNNAVSIKVQAQYNQNPYPRWHSIGYNQPADYISVLQQHFPNTHHLFPKPGAKLKTLVAGCGTGRHAIRLAKYFPSLEITALDLSHSALAYAQYQAKQHHQSNITFIQGDILHCREFKTHFDLIECSGVLHHMQDPKLGLRTLVSRLRKGGLIKIALYSKTARKAISDLRQILHDNQPKDAQAIRLVREALLQKSLPGNWEALYQSPDFYSLSGCRDLIFHEQEQAFCLSEIPEFLAQAGLNLIGILAPADSEKLLTLMGKNTHELSLDDWQALEQANTDLFSGMYQFYASKI